MSQVLRGFGVSVFVSATLSFPRTLSSHSSLRILNGSWVPAPLGTPSTSRAAESVPGRLLTPTRGTGRVGTSGRHLCSPSLAQTSSQGCRSPPCLTSPRRDSPHPQGLWRTSCLGHPNTPKATSRGGEELHIRTPGLQIPQDSGHPSACSQTGSVPPRVFAAPLMLRTALLLLRPLPGNRRDAGAGAR